MARCALLLLVACTGLTAFPCFSQTVLYTVPTGSQPVALAINSQTSKVYVVNQYSNSVTVIDETTRATATVPVGSYPTAVAVNATTNKIYVTNQSSNSVTVIDGASNSTAIVATGRSPVSLGINPVTNKIYVANYGSNSMTVINGANNATSTVAVGIYPGAVAVNSVTNKIYVTNLSSSTVTVIDGATSATTSVKVGSNPRAVAINALTNKIYVANGTYAGMGTVTVIDGATDSTAVVAAGLYPNAVAINQVTNEIYVANAGDGTVTVIDGATKSTTAIPVGGTPGQLAVDLVTNMTYLSNDIWSGTVIAIDGTSDSTQAVAVGRNPYALAMDSTMNRVYVANLYSNTVSVIAGAQSSLALQFVPVSPCRLVDTRLSNGPFGGPSISGGTSRDFIIPQNVTCSIPATAAAYALNVTLVPPPHGIVGLLSIWPSGEDQPAASIVNSWDGRFKANAAIVPAGARGAVSVYSSGTTDVVLDINGYFEPRSSSTLAFYPLSPCRIADTRWQTGDLGGPYLHAAQQRTVPVLESACGIPSTAQAYSFNFTTIPRSGPLWVFSAWPTGEAQPSTSTLNASTGTVVANAAIVPAGTNGDIAVWASNDADLVIDVNGYFAPASVGGLSLYPVSPCRVLDTRRVGSGTPFNGQLTPPLNPARTVCATPNTAHAFVFNATIVPQSVPVWLLTLWPDGAPVPNFSTLNAWDGAVTSNMAIVPTTNGSIDAYVSGLTQLVLDIFSYFAP